MLMRCFTDHSVVLRTTSDGAAETIPADDVHWSDIHGFYVDLNDGRRLAWYRENGELRLSIGESVWLFEGLAIRCEVRGDDTALIIDGMYRTAEAVYPTTHEIPPYTHLEDHDLGFFLVERKDDHKWLDGMFRGG